MTKTIMFDEPVVLDDRFWSKVNKTDTCWLWTASVNHDGYGKFSYKKRTFWVHRLSYLAIIGEIPEGMPLDHLCRVRNCVNPDHLEPVTNKENILRGEGPSAQNAKKTHCPQGHKYNKENTYIYKFTQKRACRMCDKLKKREKRKKLQNQ
jgi:hypothetical protein